MKYHVVILTRAMQDVDTIFEWLASHSPAGAARWHEAYLRARVALETNPLRHPVALESAEIGQEIREAYFRTASGKRYRFLFTVVDAEVYIHRVRGPGERPVSRDDLD